MTNRAKLKGNHDTGIDLSVGDLTTVLSVHTDQDAAVASTMTTNPTTTREDGYIQISINGVTKKIPWYDN